MGLSFYFKKYAKIRVKLYMKYFLFQAINKYGKIADKSCFWVYSIKELLIYINENLLRTQYMPCFIQNAKVGMVWQQGARLLMQVIKAIPALKKTISMERHEWKMRNNQILWQKLFREKISLGRRTASVKAQRQSLMA